ncbi:MAG: DNA repair protein RadC [Candidatus Altiarchaeota archaeon]|nr:DNA repair protein RadC [Candidatus Altiarchaeota archaeon]
MRIADIPKENRPRERLQKEGAKALSDAELLAVILRNGTCRANAVDMANSLINAYGLGKLATLSEKELRKIRGIGPAKALQIIALFEFNRRCRLDAVQKTPVKTAKDAYDYAKERIPGNDKEHLMIIYLDSKNRILRDEIVSTGTLNTTLIHPREVFKTAIKECTNSIIVAHNHPSGDPAPSRDDREITKQLKKAGELLEIDVLDHIIIGKEGYYSFREHGCM